MSDRSGSMPCTCFAGGFHNGFDLRVLGLQATFVDIQRLLIDLVAHNDDGRRAAKALDDLEPIFQPVLVFILTGVEHQQVETALGEKELMGSVHDLLPTKVPHVEANGLLVDGKLPGLNLNALGFALVFVKDSLDQALHQRRFANATLPNHQQFGFVERLLLFLLKLKVIVKEW